ncbi:MAG TPA: immunoglobulin domain-containing protein, partial [Verrucomicrobiae bacterium]|nr:immunoglobulin domain-containing protein [Verrucomicrobiae bacterium]
MKSKALVIIVVCIWSFRLISVRADVGTVIGWGRDTDASLLHSPIPLTNAIAISSRGDSIVTSDKRVVETGQPSRPELTNIIKVASGGGYSLALQEDGTVLGWTVGSTAPAVVVASNAVEVAVGEGHNLVLKRDGTIFAWGNDYFGQVDVPDDLTNAIHISAGENHSLAIRADGTVAAWGNNQFGQCSIPVGLTDVVSVAGGATHSLALKSNGTVVGWGAGDNDLGQTNTPPTATNVVAIAAGGFQSLALKADGTVVGWGWNAFGQLSIPEQGTNFIAISAQTEASYALTRLPVITAEPHGVTAIAGTNIVLNSVAVGNESWTWQWQRNGQILPGSTASSLYLTNVQVWDSGSYLVTLKSPWGSVSSSTAEVSVLPFPPTFTTQPTNQVVLSGDSAAFAASVDGARPFSFQWFFDAGVLPGATNTILVLTNVSSLDMGRYQLEVSNAYGTNLSSLALLTVNDPPSLTNVARTLELPAGTNSVLLAFAAGTQPLTYQWYLDSLPILGATNVSILLT